MSTAPRQRCLDRTTQSLLPEGRGDWRGGGDGRRQAARIFRNSIWKSAQPNPHMAFRMKPMTKNPATSDGTPPNLSGATTKRKTSVGKMPPATIAAIQYVVPLNQRARVS